MNWLSQRFFRRRLLRSALLICLLALLSTILVLAVSQYLLSQEQFRLLDETNYTTVKLDDSHFYETTTVKSSTNLTMVDWSKLTYIPGLEEEMKSFHETSEEVLLYDHKQGLTMLCDKLHRAPEHSDMSLERVMSVPEIDTSKMTIDEIMVLRQFYGQVKRTVNKRFPYRTC